MIWVVSGWISQQRASEPPFDLLERNDAYEVRHYPELTVAQVVIDASFEEAFEQAVELLMAYRAGHNLKQPVEITTVRGKTTEASESFDQVWPLIVDEKAGEVTVSMILPEPFTPDTAPRPNDPRIRIDTLERQRIAVRPMSGSVDAGTFVREQQALMRDLQGSRLLILSEPRYAFYGPTWAFWPLRMGEVHVRVR